MEVVKVVSKLIPYLQQERIFMDHMSISPAAIFAYDYCLTLHLEIKLIWLSRWTYTKVIFLLVRYMTYIDTLLVLHNQLFTDISVETCKKTYPAAMWLLALKICLAEGMYPYADASVISFKFTISKAILAIRTWAVWHRDRKIGIGLAVLTLAHLVSQCWIMRITVQPIKYIIPVYAGFRGCIIQREGVISPLNYVPLTAVEAVILTLMSISAFRSYRQGDNGKLLNIIYRDGVFLYVFLLVISTANMAVLMVLNPSELMMLLTPLESVMYSVMTTRIILNIRDESHRSVRTELHVSYNELPGSLIPLGVLRDDHSQSRCLH